MCAKESKSESGDNWIHLLRKGSNMENENDESDTGMNENEEGESESGNGESCTEKDDIKNILQSRSEQIAVQVHNIIENQQHESTEESATESEEDEHTFIDDFFQKESEETILRVFNDHINTKTKLYRDSSERTLLHIAAENGFLNVADQFLDNGVNPLAYDMWENTPLHIAIEKSNDEMAALIVSKLPNFVVRRIFGDIKAKESTLEASSMKQKTHEKKKYTHTYDKHTVEPMFEIKQLVDENLDKTLLQVLDSFIEKQSDGSYIIHVKLLDIDDTGRKPKDGDYSFEDYTTFQHLARFKKHEALKHPVVRELMEHKWKHWCRQRFLFYGCMYLFSLFCLTYSAVTGATASDVRTYDTGLQYSRAVMEVISYLYALAILFSEIRQVISQKFRYFAHFFNYMELFSSILMIFVLPLRYTHLTAHWYVFALGYFLWAIRIFKYAIVFRQSGEYIEVIKRILAQDFVQFSILFLVINAMFSGTFLLVLKADDSLNSHIETSSFQGILYVGVRTLIEAAPIVDYTGSDGYRFAGTIIMIVYMFFTIVVMLNILIAQLSETYSKTHDECIKTVRVNRAWIIARAERNLWKLQPRHFDWTKYYKSTLDDVDIKNNEQDSSDLDFLSKKIESMRKKQIEIGLEVHTMENRQRQYIKNVEEKVDALTEMFKQNLSD